MGITRHGKPCIISLRLALQWREHYSLMPFTRRVAKVQKTWLKESGRCAEKNPMNNKFIPKKERLRTLYSIMQGIPEEKVDLKEWRNDQDSQEPSYSGFATACESVACAVGWATVYPPFKEAGLLFDGEPLLANYKGVHKGIDAVQEFFGLTKKEADNIFFTRDTRRENATTKIYEDSKFKRLINYPHSEKRLVLMRIRNYLYSKKVITKTRNQELKAFEEANYT
jgi:hypothetical protein